MADNLIATSDSSGNFSFDDLTIDVAGDYLYQINQTTKESPQEYQLDKSRDFLIHVEPNAEDTALVATIGQEIIFDNKAPVTYLAGDVILEDGSQVMQWIEADEERHFYDEEGKWSRILGGESGYQGSSAVSKY